MHPTMSDTRETPPLMILPPNAFPPCVKRVPRAMDADPDLIDPKKGPEP
jgi:hypothetical protein